MKWENEMSGLLRLQPTSVRSANNRYIVVDFVLAIHFWWNPELDSFTKQSCADFN